MALEETRKPAAGPAVESDLFARKGRASARGFGTASAVDVVAAEVARVARPRAVIEIDRARSSGIAPGIAPTLSRRQHRALVADGDGLSRKLYRDVLEADGYEVVAAADGFRALEAARRHTPDVAVINLRLADSSGLELARQIAAEGFQHYIPIIAIAEMHRAADEAAARDEGCAAYLAKPISVRVFLDTIDELVRRSRAPSCPK